MTGPPPPPPPPPTVDLIKSNKLPSSGNRGNLLSDIQKKKTLKKVKESDKKRPLTPHELAKGVQPSSSGGSSSGGGKSSSNDPPGFKPTGNAMLDEMQRKRLTKKMSSGSSNLPKTNTVNTVKSPRSKSPPKVPGRRPPPVVPGRNQSSSTGGNTTQLKNTSGGNNAPKVPSRRPAPQVPNRRVPPPTPSGGKTTNEKAPSIPSRRPSPGVPQKTEEKTVVKNEEKKAPPPVVRRPPPKPVDKSEEKKETPPPKKETPPPVEKKETPPPVAKRPPPPQPKQEEKKEDKSPPPVVKRPPPKPVQTSSVEEKKDTQIEKSSENVEKEGRFLFKKDLPNPPKFQNIKKVYRSGRVNQKSFKTNEVSKPSENNPPVGPPPPVPVEKEKVEVKKAPPSIPVKPEKKDVDYTERKNKTVEALKKKMGDYAASYQFEKCPPLRDMMMQLEKETDNSKLGPLLDNADKLLS